MQQNYTPDVAAALAEIGAVFEFPAPTILANGVVAESAIGMVGPGPVQIPLSSIWVHPSAAMVATDAVNYLTISVYKRTAGGARVLIGSITTQPVGSGGSGSWVAFTPFKLVLVAGAFLAANDSITYQVTQTGTGSANATGTFYLAGYTTLN